MQLLCQQCVVLISAYYKNTLKIYKEWKIVVSQKYALKRDVINIIQGVTRSYQQTLKNARPLEEDHLLLNICSITRS